MKKKALARVINVLESDPDFFVPVQKLFRLLESENLVKGVSLEAFQKELETDEQFTFTEGVDYQDGMEGDDDIAKQMEQEMEDLGFYGGPRVKLTEREMSPEAIFEAMTRNLARMNQALQNAWDARPTGDQETEDQLLEILAAGQRLETEIENIVDKQTSQDD